MQGRGLMGSVELRRHCEVGENTLHRGSQAEGAVDAQSLARAQLVAANATRTISL